MIRIDDIVAQVAGHMQWDEHVARNARDAYLRFLKAAATDSAMRPSVEVDAVWHAHILHTRRYREDCMTIAGGFIDHEPGVDAGADMHSTGLELAGCGPSKAEHDGTFTLGECGPPKTEYVGILKLGNCGPSGPGVTPPAAIDAA